MSMMSEGEGVDRSNQPDAQQRESDNQDTPMTSTSNADKHKRERKLTEKGRMYEKKKKEKAFSTAVTRWQKISETEEFDEAEIIEASASVEEAYELLRDTLDTSAAEKANLVMDRVKKRTASILETLSEEDVESMLDSLLTQLGEDDDHIDPSVYESVLTEEETTKTKNTTEEETTKTKNTTEEETTKTKKRMRGEELSILPPPGRTEEAVADSAASLAAVVERMELPRTEIPTYNGNPLEYNEFIAAFEDAVGSKGIQPDTKLRHLVRNCEGPARDAVKPCLLMAGAEGYRTARKILQKRFGDSFLVARAHVRALTEGPAIKPDNSAELVRFSDSVQTCTLTLKSLGRTWEIDSQESMAKVAQRLPKYLQSRWRGIAYRYKKEQGDYPSFVEFAEFIEDAAAEATDSLFGLNVEEKDSKANNDKKSPKTRTRGTVLAATKTDSASAKPQSKPKCPKCSQQHFLNQCADFRALPVKDRVLFTKEKSLCMNCFGANHFAKDCFKTWRCNIEGCNQKHNRWLHANERPTETTEHQVQQRQQVTMATTFVDRAKVALPIKRVLVQAANGMFVSAFALHDTGSDVSLCNAKLVQKLNLPKKDICVTFTTATGKQRGQYHSTNLTVKSTVSDDLIFEMKGVIVKKSIHIDAKSIVTSKDLSPYPYLQELGLPEMDLEDVDLLIGQDNPELLIPLETRYGESGSPYAVRTQLGWGVSGPIARNHNTYHCNVHFAGCDLVQKRVEEFWSLEQSSTTEKLTMSKDDKAVLEEWSSSASLVNRHYTLAIPFKEDPPQLTNNISMATRRLDSLGRRLKNDAELHQKYSTSIEEYLKNGHAEPVDQGQTDPQVVWYLPHHPVTHPRKPGKVRVVFDCAAEYGSTSLNKATHQGPDLTNNLTAVLLRFRRGQIAISADIENMFNQVLVPEHQRDALRFLWWKDNDPNQEIVCYRMCTHLFGGTWSPSAASYALRRLTEDFKDDTRELARHTVLDNFYVDDCLQGVATIQEGIQLVADLKTLLEKGGFHLHKWISNSKEIMKTIPPSERSKSLRAVDLEEGDLPADRMLGVLWDAEDDCFCFEVHPKQSPDTKRGVLSSTCSIYDPLGFISPFVLKARAIFQETCRMKLGWDEEITDELRIQWQRWLEDIPLLSQMKFPRCLEADDCNDWSRSELHVFSDASEMGYGAVAYMKTEGTCSIVMAKTRLAPVKLTTVPRLELAAAVVAAELGGFVRETFCLQLKRTYYWTDSTTVLQYLSNRTKRFKTYVANRIEKILTYTNVDQWNYVPTKENPADDVSRGLMAQELVDNYRWKHGPTFLLNEEKWPAQPHGRQLNLHDCSELKKEIRIYAGSMDAPSVSIDRFIRRCSSWVSLKKAVAWILRLKSKLRKRTISSGPLEVFELKEAENAIIQYVQQQLPEEEHLRSLDPFKEDGIVKVGGRLSRSSLEDSAKHPIILPKEHPVARLIAQHYHHLNGHSGAQRTLADMRQVFWPISGHTLAKSLVKHCLKCRKMRAPTQSQKMSDLPADRVTPGGPPFANTGVDYFGPIIVKRGRSEIKRYGCLFTCLVTRAVHLEVSTSLETDSFLQALQRFIARRGQPLRIRSDNGTNFVGGKREMIKSFKEWNQKQIHDYLLLRDIDWIFNPPAASHMGGAWERQIGTVRRVMLGVCDSQRLSDEGLATLFCKVESIVNGRPMTKLSGDPFDMRPLTPNQLLLFEANTATLPPGKFVLQDLYRKKWRQVEYLADLFWTRWTKEYLPSLQERSRWRSATRNLGKGDLVLVSGNSTSRNDWPLGLVVDTFPGPDSLVRTVKVKTKAGEFVRPISKLCLLEANIADLETIPKKTTPQQRQ